MGSFYRNQPSSGRDLAFEIASRLADVDSKAYRAISVVRMAPPLATSGNDACARSRPSLAWPMAASTPGVARHDCARRCRQAHASMPHADAHLAIKMNAHVSGRIHTSGSGRISHQCRSDRTSSHLAEPSIVTDLRRPWVSTGARSRRHSWFRSMGFSSVNRITMKR